MKIEDLSPYQKAVLFLLAESAGRDETYIEDLLKEPDPGPDTITSSFNMVAGGYSISIITYIDPILDKTEIKDMKTGQVVNVQWFIYNILPELPPGQKRLLTEKLNA